MIHALRSLRKNPGFAIIAVLTLALGIGANTAIFSIVNGVLLSPLRYPDADRIVALATPSTPRISGGDLMDIRADGQIFDALSYYYGGEMGVQVPRGAEFTGIFFVNPDFFRVFGVRPLYGRWLEPGDLDRAAVISLPFAERNFGNAASALGNKLSIANRAYEIAGVVPAALDFPGKANVWLPAPETPRNLSRTDHNYAVIGKLKPGVTLAAANARLQIFQSIVAIPLRDRLVGPVRGTLYFLMGAVALVLLIACTNVANLLLARATARSRETAVKAALGARGWHIIRPLLMESAVLALTGGALGLLLAQLGTAFVGRLPLPRLTEVRVDWMVLGFTCGISLLTILFFGLAPAWQAARVDLHDTLRSRGKLGGSSPRLRNALVVAQIALSFVLAIGAGLLLRSFLTLTSVQLGYRTEGILVMYAHAPARSLDEYVGVGRLIETLREQLNALPGVTSVAAAMGLPTGQYGSSGSYAVEGKHRLAGGQNLPQAGFRLASPAYFQTMGIPLIGGREFSPRDQYDSPFVAIVSQALARQSFPNEDPIGRRLQCGLDAPSKWMTIVGVVGDVRQQSPASAPAAELYMPLKQHPYFANELQVVLRATAPPESLIAPVQQRVRALNPEIAMKFTSMETMVADTIAKPRVRMFLIGVFAALALLLAMAGVYGVMNYVVTLRTPEFGLRVALGASPGNVVRLVLGRALRLAAAGLATGMVLSLAAGSLISSMLFGLKPADAITYAIVVGAVTPMILLAAAIPAWRATRIDPLTALREE
ncbi:MAG TPA: ABC transporter permease [Bryobacteraceae bacterium]